MLSSLPTKRRQQRLCPRTLRSAFTSTTVLAPCDFDGVYFGEAFWMPGTPRSTSTTRRRGIQSTRRAHRSHRSVIRVRVSSCGREWTGWRHSASAWEGQLFVFFFVNIWCMAQRLRQRECPLWCQPLPLSQANAQAGGQKVVLCVLLCCRYSSRLV